MTQLEPKDGEAPVRLLTKIALLGAILAADLLFFFLLPTYFPETFDAVFQMTPWPDDADFNVGAGIGGYSIRWEWNAAEEVVNKTFFGGNVGAQLAYHRTDALDLIVGGTYHVISIDDFYDEEDLYHVVELRLGVALHLSDLGSRQ